MRLGYDPDQVISSEMPTGNQTGPWKTSVAGKVAHEIALEVILTAYPNDDDGRTTLELTVHVLIPEGFQIRGEALRRPPMSEEEESERKKARRLVLYAMHPADMMNLRPEVYSARLRSFKTMLMANLMFK